MRFFFTYGSEGQPFYGGWSEVEAPDFEAALLAFQAFHPNQESGLLNCAEIYDEAHFITNHMYERGNFGARCHERITLRREAGNL